MTFLAIKFIVFEDTGSAPLYSRQRRWKPNIFISKHGYESDLRCLHSILSDLHKVNSFTFPFFSSLVPFSFFSLPPTPSFSPSTFFLFP